MEDVWCGRSFFFRVEALKHVFARFESRLNRVQQVLWALSAACIVIAAIAAETYPLTLAASLVGVTSLIFAAAGALFNVATQCALCAGVCS